MPQASLALYVPFKYINMIDHQTSLGTTQSQLPRVKQRVQFPGLNTIRFYAALAVVIDHVGAQFPPDQRLFRFINSFFPEAQNAVNLFFVLSGFLITYLLIYERTATGQINVRNFYIRRTLRIWPLYYLVALSGLVVFPVIFGSDYPLTGLPGYKIALVLCLLPNFAWLSGPMIHLWSIGVEEQFYAIWPWVNRSDTTILRVSFGIIIIKLLTTPIVLSFSNDKMAAIFLYSLRFECMAIGALGAYLYAKKTDYLKWVYHPCVQILTLIAFVYLNIFNVPVTTYNIIWASLVYIVLIMNVATNQCSLLKLNFHPFEKLGEISYGLYLYHFPVLYLIYFATHHIGLERIWASPFWLLIITVISTWVSAVLSYRWFETSFLNLKKNFTMA